VARELTPADLDALLGAYALDAVDAEERDQIEVWLTREPGARRDADELRETASLLAQLAVDPPGDLWSRIEERLGEPAEPGTVAAPPLRFGGAVDLDARRAAATERPSRRRPWLVGVAAALALVVAVGVGVVAGRELSSQGDRIDRLAAGMEERAMERAALAAAMAPGSRAAELADPDGTTMAKVVLTPDGRGYFMTEAMPTLAAGRTYQLWAVMGDEPGSPAVSVGVLGPDPSMTAFHAGSGVTGFAVTEEPAPGVTRSDEPRMLEGRLA
jgi:hypothetical protein